MSRKESRKPQLSIESLERRELMAADFGYVPMPFMDQPPVYVASPFAARNAIPITTNVYRPSPSQLKDASASPFGYANKDFYFQSGGSINVVRNTPPPVSSGQKLNAPEYQASWGLRGDPDYPLGYATFKSEAEARAWAQRKIESTQNNGDWAVTHVRIEEKWSTNWLTPIRSDQFNGGLATFVGGAATAAFAPQLAGPSTYFAMGTGIFNMANSYFPTEYDLGGVWQTAASLPQVQQLANSFGIPGKDVMLVGQGFDYLGSLREFPRLPTSAQIFNVPDFVLSSQDMAAKLVSTSYVNNLMSPIWSAMAAHPTSAGQKSAALSMLQARDSVFGSVGYAPPVQRSTLSVTPIPRYNPNASVMGNIWATKPSGPTSIPPTIPRWY